MPDRGSGGPWEWRAGTTTSAFDDHFVIQFSDSDWRMPSLISKQRPLKHAVLQGVGPP